ncbi:MAG: AAA family ATPase, partial [Clostridia bacterium]
MSIISVILSGKGGVGKSTITVGLGRALAKKANSVLLIDCDAGLRTLDRMTATENNLVYDLSDIALGNCDISQAIYKVENQDNLFIIPAPINEHDLPSISDFKKIIKSLHSRFDYIFLDAGAGLGASFELTSSVADNAIVVCTPDPVCVRASFSVHNILEQKKLPHKLIINKFNPSLFKKIGIFEDLDRVIDETSISLLGVVPHDDNLVAFFFTRR